MSRQNLLRPRNPPYEKRLDPSLARIYGLADDEARIAYFDQTYTGANEDGRSFYAITATIYRKKSWKTYGRT